MNEAIADGRRGSARSTVGSVVTRWAAARSDFSAKVRLQYEWAAGHNAEGLGAIRTRERRHITSGLFEMYSPESGLGTAGGGPTVRT